MDQPPPQQSSAVSTIQSVQSGSTPSQQAERSVSSGTPEDDGSTRAMSSNGSGIISVCSSSNGDTRKRSHPTTTASEEGSGSSKRQSVQHQHQNFTPANGHLASVSSNGSIQTPEVTDSLATWQEWGQARQQQQQSLLSQPAAVSKLVQTLQSALEEYSSPSSSTTVSTPQGSGPSSILIDRLKDERDAAIARIAILEKERDDALRARDHALKIAEESYRELRAVVESRFRRIQELKDSGGMVSYE